MAPASHSLEADLRAAREAAGLTIEDIHHETRLATDIIQRFEAGQLIGDPSFNAVYLRAFLRSYAEAVGLGPHRVEAAWEATLEGAYRGELHPDFAGDKGNLAEETVDASAVESEDGDEDLAARKESRFPKVDPLPAAVSPGSAAFSVPTPTPYASARPTRRLQKQVRPSSGKSFDSAWGAILGVTVLIVVAVLAVLWLLFRNDTPEPDVAALDRSDSVAASASDSLATGGASGQSLAPRLTFPIQVSVVAGGDGLQSFRVTEAPGEQRPVWVEPGETASFSSNDGVVLWGEYATGLNPEEVTLRFQGYEWRPPQGQILRIDRTHGQTLLDSLHAAFPSGGRTGPQS